MKKEQKAPDHIFMEVMIRGATGTGNTPWAQFVEGQALENGARVGVSDGEQFEFDRKYQKKLGEVRHWAAEKEHDVLVLCVTAPLSEFGRGLQINVSGLMSDPCRLMEICRARGMVTGWNRDARVAQRATEKAYPLFSGTSHQGAKLDKRDKPEGMRVHRVRRLG